MKQNLANLSKYREEDVKKVEVIQNQIEENKKSSADKLAALEKFILSVKEATEKAATQARPQSQFEANLNMMEDLRSLNSRTESLTYKFDGLSYDLGLIKSDIIRQQRTQQNYFEKIDKLERKIDMVPIGNSVNFGSKGVNVSSGNFMANASRTVDDQHNFNKILAGVEVMSKQTNSTAEKDQPRSSNKNYFMDDDLDKEFGKDNFGINLSIIDKGPDHSELLEDDIFQANPAGKKATISAPGHFPTEFAKMTGPRYMESIAEVDAEHDKSKTRPSHVSDKPSPPAPHVIGPRTAINTSIHEQPPITTGAGGFVLPQQSKPIQQTQPSKPGQNPQPIVSQPTQASDLSRKPTLDRDQSLLNQSLNSSIRIQKAVLRKVNESVADVTGKHADESSIIELNIDDNGFLIDGNGFPILNDKGEPMRLTDDNIDFLKENGLYEEEVIESGD